MRGPLSLRFPVPGCDDATTVAANRASFDALEASAGRSNHYGVGESGPLHLHGAEWARGLLTQGVMGVPRDPWHNSEDPRGLSSDRESAVENALAAAAAPRTLCLTAKAHSC